MNQTPNYQLSQWESTDRILMSDFNSDNAKLDAALKAQSDAIAAKAAQSTVAALTQTVSTKASQSALDSLTQTVAGHTAALAGKGNCQMEVLTYTGSGRSGASNPNTLQFSQKPLAVLIFGTGVAFTSPDCVVLWVLVSSNVDSCSGSWSADGKTYSWYGGNAAEQMNQATTYTVVALYPCGE